MSAAAWQLAGAFVVVAPVGLLVALLIAMPRGRPPAGRK